jgi:hypothetical protein
VTSGGGTWNAGPLRTAPSPTTSLNVLTRIGPSAASDGTSTLSCFGVSGAPVWVAVAVYGANRTSPPTGGLAAVPELLRRFVPRMVTTIPGNPAHGVTNVMVGEQPPGFALVNLVGLLAVALALVTWILPLASPATVAQISLPETTLNAETGVPPISTLVTIGSLKFVPVITTTHPAGPLVGENEEMVGGAADAGASRPSTTRAATTATAATRSPRCRLKRVMAPSSLLARDTRQSSYLSAMGSGRQLLALPHHPDEHSPERPILLAVDQRLGERPVLLQDPVKMPAVRDALQFVLAGVLEHDTRSGDQVLYGL